MKKVTVMKRFVKVCSGVTAVMAYAVLFCGLVGTAVAANGPAYYLDTNGATSGFGDPTTASSANSTWSLSSAGTDSTVAFPANAQFVFGYPGTAGISNDVIAFSIAQSWLGITLNVPCTVNVNAYQAGVATTPQTWTVTNGATLNLNQSYWNANNAVITLQGGGIINVNNTCFGFNDGNTTIQDMSGGVVNLLTGYYDNVTKQAGYTLKAGTLNFAAAAASKAFNVLQTRALAINGGTLDNTSGSAMTLDRVSGNYEIGGSFTFTGASSLNFNTNAVNLKAGTQTITVSANTLTFGGIISNGGMVKAGAGTLALSGNNTYSGATTINAGTLQTGVTGGCSNSAVTVAATSGNTALLALSVTDSTKQWTCSSLAMNNAGTSSGLQFAFGAMTPSTTLAPLKASGSVTFSTAPAITVSGASLPLSSGNGYPLVTWGSGSPTTNGVALALPLRVVGNLAVVDNTLYLQITGNTGPLSWTGGDGTWDVNNSGNATIWKDNTSVNTYYQEGASMDSVLFDTTVGTGGTITLNTNVSPNSVTVNASSNYTFSGSGGIAGTAGLIKSGTGMLTLNTRNTYSGATTINAGTLLIAVGSSCSNSAVSVAATAGNPATLSVAVTNTVQQWVCAALTVNNAGVASGLDFNFGTLTPSTTVAPLKITGMAAFSTLPAITVTLGDVGAAGTQYPLMTWGSGSVAVPTNLIVNAPRGLVTHLTVSGTTLNLVVDVVNGTPYYLDVNGTTPGFGDPSGTYTEAQSVWTTSSAGTATPGTLPNNSQLTFGYPGSSGVSNCTFTVNPAGNPWSGYVVNVPCTINYIGQGYGGVNQTWLVTQGASFTLAGYFNFNNANVTLQGAGVVNDNGYMGFNCLSSTIKQDMGSGTVNLLKAWVNASPSQLKEKQANYILQRGMLNFATAASASAFGATNPVSRTVAFNGGTLDNTSGAAITLNVGSANYSIGGSFTFAGSSSLTLTNTVNLGTGTPTITVNQNTLTIGAAITNTAGLNKAGAGTLVLSGTNTYSGGTTVSGGMLLLEGGITGAVNVVGGLLGGSGTVGGVVTNQATLSAAGTNSIGVLTTAGLVMKENSTCVWNYNDTSRDVIQVNGNLTLPAVATVAVSRVTSGSLPSRGILFNGFSSIVTNVGTLSGWVITGAAPRTYAEVEGDQVVLVTRPIGTMIRIF